MKYIVKRRHMSPAKRNPFRPRQVLKRSKWETMGAFDTYEDAVRWTQRVRIGMSECCICHGKTKIMQDSYGRFPESCPA